MKKSIFIILIIVIFIKGTNQEILAASNSGKCGENINWYYDSKTKVLLLKGKGATYNYSTSQEAGEYTMKEWNSFKAGTDDYKVHNDTVKPRPWYKNQDNIKKIIIRNGITEIKACTFFDMNNLEEVELPSSLKIIGNGAFAYTNLKKVNIPNSVVGIKGMAFFSCKNLKNVTFGKNIDKIGEDAFAYSGLTKLSLFEKIKQIDNEAFSQCENLMEVDLKKCINLTRIEPYIFYDCIKLKSIVIPEKIKDISEYAFYNCRTLNNVNFDGSKINNIKKSAFGNCESLKKIIITGEVYKIGERAFENCKKLKEIKIKSKSLENKSVGKRAFKGVKLKKLIVPSSFETPPTKVDGSKYKKKYEFMIKDKGGKIAEVVVSTDINSFKQTISPFQYKIISTGMIGAKKENGIWYYTFTKNGDTVRIKTKAFYTELDGLNLKERIVTINDQLTNVTIRDDNIPIRRDYFYKKNIIKKQKGIVENKYYEYTETICPIYIQSRYSDESAGLSLLVGVNGKNKDYPQVSFVYKEKVKTPASLGKMKKPTNEKEYIAAIKRNNTSYSVVPKVGVKVKKAGTNLTYLSNYRYTCVGQVEKNSNIDEWIDVFYTTISLIESSASRSVNGVVSSLYSLMESGIDINGNNKVFEMSQTEILSGDKNGVLYKTMEANFKSPYRLSKSNDYFQVDIELTKKLSSEKIRGELELSFEIYDE